MGRLLPAHYYYLTDTSITFILPTKTIEMLQATIIGHIGQDATIKDVNGKTVVNFSVAHTERYKNSQGVQTEKTTWVEVADWNAANLAPWLKKGSLVCVQGTPSSQAWNDKEGAPASKLVITSFRIDLLISTAQKTDNGQQQNGQSTTDKNAQDEAAYQQWLKENPEQAAAIEKEKAQKA